MQNRFVLSGIPVSVPKLPNAADNFRDLIEDHGCWVDRFTFLNNQKNSKEENNDITIVAAAELHIENVRDRAVKSLDGLIIVLRKGCGDIHWSGQLEDKNESYDDPKKFVSFQIRAFPANLAQSELLIQQCPFLETGFEDSNFEEKMTKQHFKLSYDFELFVQKSNKPGGTGTNPWRGGVILATHLFHWFQRNKITAYDYQKKVNEDIDFTILFKKKKVLELGAGSTSLPSMTLALLEKQNKFQMDLTTSDGIDEIVSAIHLNVHENGLQKFLKVKRMDWNDSSTFCDDKDASDMKADTIIFSDCVYNEEGAIALSNTIRSILNPKGHVIGVLPDFRVGVDVFEKVMKENDFAITIIPMAKNHEDKCETSKFVCAGGSGKNYRLVYWNLH